MSRALRLAVAACAVASLAVTLGGSLAPASGQDLPRERWRAANEAYRSGDPQGAARAYRALLATASDPLLEADLAAALWRSGNRGEAVLHYLRAVRLDPRNGVLRDDLADLRVELGDPPSTDGPPAPLDRVRPDEFLLALLALGAVAAFVGWRSRTEPGWRAAFGALLAAVLLIAAATVVAARSRAEPRGVVLAGARVAGRPGGVTIGSLPEGAVVRVLGRTADGWRVRGAGAPPGWVASDAIAPLD